jgi:uncharacterized metal-binding protein
MSSGKTHDRITYISLPLVMVVGWGCLGRIDLTLWLGGSFMFGGLMCGPDLDILSVQSARWGCLQWLWHPYRKAIPHRSLWSHGPIVGTLGRLLYLGLWGLLGLLLYQWLAPLLHWPSLGLGQVGSALYRWSIDHRPQAIAGLVGLELGAMTHYLADGISSTYKRLGAKRRPKARR